MSDETNKTESKKYTKITLKQMPRQFHDDLEWRASRLFRSVPQYCQLVLEHALRNRSAYKGSLKNDNDQRKSGYDKEYYHKEIHIPVGNADFIKELKEWDPNKLRYANRIALSILQKHLELDIDDEILLVS